MLPKKDFETWVLAVSINKLSAANLNDDSGFYLRQSQPNRYTESTLTIGSNHFTIFTDTTATGFSKVAFCLHGDMSGDIALQGANNINNDVLATTFSEILSSWKWR